MKKLSIKLTIFSLLFILIFGLIFFSVEKYNSTVEPVQYLAGDTDGVTSTKLSSLYAVGWEGMFTFSSTTYEYTLPLFNETIRLEIRAVAQDKDATVKIEGNHYLTDLYGTVTITVSNGIESDSIYKINWNRDLQTYVNNPTNYTTSGGRSYTTPYTGYYKLEVWGAQGGSSSSGNNGGYGGYSVGTVRFTKGTTMYIQVGGSGTNCQGINCTCAGGYNGGGGARGHYNCGSTVQTASGGGATHIALVDGVLSNIGYANFVTNKKGLIVAGGGGGGNLCNSCCNYAGGGHGGGSVAVASINRGAPHWSQNGGAGGTGGTQSAGNAFGLGGGGTTYDSVGGGGGFYGGKYTVINGSGGGSGWIASEQLISYKGLTKHMAGYSTPSANTTASTYTISATGVSSTPTVDYAKSGAGAAKISAVTPISNNYYLKSLTSNIGTFKTEFTPSNFEPFISVGVYNGSITLTGEVDDTNSTVTGFGKYSLELGYNYIDIYVTAPNGDVGTYHVTVLRENMKGKHSSEIYRIYNKNTDEYIYTEEKQVSYDINIYKHQSTLDMDIYTFDSDATYTIIGNNLLKDGDTIKILVEAPKVASTIYILTVHKISMPSDDYSYSGQYKVWVAPQSGRYRIELWGAQGGYSYYANNATSGSEARGGYGAYTAGDIILKKGDTLYVYVGEQGKHGVYGTRVGASWNGGGQGGSNYQGAAGGGGATDVRLTPASTSNKTAFNNTNSFISRIMVAGGGGGAATYANAANGANAGGLSGYGGILNASSAGHTYAGGGTQLAGGSAGSNGCAGSFGLGAQYSGVCNDHDAGGGGGYFGGGSGTIVSGGVASAAGGSSYISGHAGCVGRASSTSTSGYQACSQGTTEVGCSYHNSRMIFTDTVMVDGSGYAWTNVKGSTTGNMPKPDGGNYSEGRTGNGYAKITPNFQSENNYLKSLSTDTGVWNQSYDYNIDNYTVTVESNIEIVTVSAEKGEDLQTISGLGPYVLDVGDNEINVEVTAENGDTKLYTLNVVRKGVHPSSKLYKLTIDDIKVDIYDGEEEYDVEVPSSQFSFNVVGYPYDDEATITYTGFGYVKKNKTCYVTVYSEGASPETTIYKINLIKSDDVSDVEFNYTGNIQTFTVKTTGYYLLETWGAQGGSANSNYIGGYGAYSSGVVYLTEGTTLYIGVGGRGNTCTGQNCQTQGGYNGGGSGVGYSNCGSGVIAAGGGGATHIAYVDGTLSSIGYTEFVTNKKGLIISGGGGGGNYCNYWNYANGGHGGGATAVSSINRGAPHWSQNGGGSARGASQSSGYAFGQGGGLKTNYADTGGGGGFYGGYASGINGAGGGSGYIGSSSLMTFADYVKHMTCYSCSTSSAVNTMTKSTTKVSANAISDYAKSGNGYAKISYLHLSNDNYLKSIKISDITDDKNITTLYTEESTDEEPVKETITINADSTNLTNIRIESKPNDSTATVLGNGEYLVRAGENTYEIKVTAENLEVRTYTIKINRNADTNVQPDNIEINGLVQSLCSQGDDYCVLHNSVDSTNVFNKDIHEYTMTVPSRIKQVKFNVIKGHYFQEVTGDGIQDLTQSTTGTTDITIDIKSEACVVNNSNDPGCYSHYTYHITRDTSSDTDLKRLFVDKTNTTGEFTIDPASDADVPIEFNFTNPDVYDYYFSVPNEWTYLKYLYYELDAPGQEVEVIGNDVGAFEEAGRTYLVQVRVTAPNKVDTATYRLHVFREFNTSIFLTALSVSHDGTTYPLNLTFTKSAFDYEVTIPYEVNSVDVNYTIEVPATTSAVMTTNHGTKSGNTISGIPTGKTEILITTTSQSNDVGVYTITLTRTYNDDSSISSLIVKTDETEWELDPEFEASVFDYTTTVDEGVSSVEIIATPTDTASGVVTLLDNNSIIVGDNIKRILVKAEDGSFSTYTVTITRPASTDASLKTLTVIGSDTKNYGVALVDETFDYEINVPNDVTFVNVTGVKNSNLATVYGNGKYFLQVGENTIQVIVQAENQLLQTYTLTINRAYNSNARLSVISGSETITPSFNENDEVNTSYTINVPYTTTKMNLLYTPSAITTVVTAKDESDNVLNGKRANNSYTLPMDLVTGNNKVKLITLAEDGTTTLTYNVNVLKEASDDATLKTLRLKETRLVPTNEENVFIAKLPFNADPAHLIVEVNDPNSHYVITASNGLTVNDDDSISGLTNNTSENVTHTITITVTAEDASIEVYTIDLTMQAEGNASNYLMNLTVDKGTLTPVFNKDIMYYEVEVPNNTNNITVSATLDDEDATVTGTGTYNNLGVGENPINVVVTATDGYERTYQVIVKRAPSDDATLKQISINEASLSPSFDSNTYTYTTSVDGTYIDFASIVPTSSYATYEVINNEAGTLVNTGDTAIVTIKVTAEDKVTTKEYKITATKLPSGNNNLASLSVVGYTLTPTFDKSVTLYRTNVENDVSTVLVEATAEDSGATITGVGVITLSTGENSVSVDVTSESGVTKSYLLIITRAYSSNANIEYLNVNNGQMDKTFDKNTTSYEVVIDYETTKLDLSVILEDPSASYEVTGNNITGNTGLVTVTVIAEDGTSTKDYELHVTKDLTKNALLKDLSESSYEFKSKFNSYIFNYEMTVNYETTELDLTAIPVNSAADVNITGYNNLIVGDNTVTVTVTSEDGIVTQDYTIKVTRNKEVNNYLDYLFNDYGTGDFDQPFNSLTLKYTLTVDSDTESIILYGEKKSRDSIITFEADNRTVDSSLISDSYLGTFGLEKGTNVIKIKVTNQGYTRTYIVTITRRLNSDKELLTLIVRGNNKRLTLNPEFTVGREEPYSLSVDKDTNVIELSGTVSPLATASGLGDVFLNPGLNEVNITVTAEDGTTKVVTINVNKEASSNAYLIDLVPSSGNLNPSFGYEETTYSLELDSSVLTLSFDATLEDANATISGLDEEIVPDGTSVRTITVTAEDKTTIRTYTINVSKIISDDADLLNLKVKNYDFIDDSDETTKVTFDKDNLEYYVIVDNDKLTLDKDDLIITKSNQKSKITYSEGINLNTKNYSEYSLLVTAEDGISKKNYKVFVKRKMGSSSEILKVSPTMGYLETTFFSNEYNYVWKIPAGKVPELSRLGVTLKDSNATIETSLNDKTLSVVVTSEDGSSVSTYVFTGEIDYNKNVLIEDLKVYDIDNEYPYEPKVEDEVFEYTAHVYDNLDKVRIRITPQAENALVYYQDEEVVEVEVDLSDDVNEFEFIILGEDGVTEQPYTVIVKRDISTVGTASYIRIVDEDEVCITKTCNLSPTFDPDATAYRTSVPYEYEILNIDVGLNEQQSFKLYYYSGDSLQEINNNEFELDIVSADFYIFIYDLLGNQTKSYKLTVTRNKSTNTKLNSLTISKDGSTYELQDKDGVSLPFSNDINEYYITVPYSVDSVDVNYVLNSDDQKVKTNGYNNFYIGELNDISVKVTAPDKKTIRTIIIHAYRESEFEVYLEDIVVSSGFLIYELSPEFDKRKTSYVVNVTNGTEYVKVEGFGDTNTQVSEAETRLIQTGINDFEIVASKTIDGEVRTKTYTISIIRPIASEVYLSNLKVSSTIDGEYATFKNELGADIPFDRGTTDYYLEVSPGIKSLSIDATPGRSEWNVETYGNNFATGRNIVSIIVYNEEYTTSRTYQIIVTVKPSQDASITAVTVKDDEETYGVSAEDFALVDDNIYSVNVPYEVDKVDVSVTPTIDVATVQGNGTYYLEYGNNVVTIDVIAEDGETTETYTVNIFRAYNLYLSAINEDCDETDIKEEFLKTKNDYTMEVSNDVTSFNIEGIPEENNVTVTYSLDNDTAAGGEIINGKLYTGVGINKVLITVTAPDNTSNVYSLNVTRKQSDNNYLSALDFNEGNLNEVFVKENNSYTMYILDTYTSLSYDNKKDILTEDPTASYVVSGLSPLSKTQDNTVTITVTSQSGKTNIYTVTVMLKPEAWFKHYLQKLELTYKTKGQNNEDITNYAVLSPQFNMEKMAYTSTVPYGVASITVNTQTVVPDDEALIRASTETGSSIANGTFALNLGRNVINVKVYSTLANNDGSYAIYKVIVYRQSNPDAYLSNLAISNYLLSPGFSSTVFNYEISIDTSETELDIDAVPRDPNATVTITGNGPFHEGSNTITIHVLAADGSTYLNYYITANCELSDNNYLASLDVKDYEIDPGFTKTNTGVYLVNVDNDVTSVYVTAIKEDQSATMTLQNGSPTYTKESTSIKLNPGNNYIYIAVNSARGNTRTYTLNVFRSYSTDNTLRDLIISDGTLKPSFDPETKEYDVILEDNLYYLSNVSVIGLKNHSKATVRGNGEYTLNKSGTKTVTIEVTAESGDKREYKVNFIKKEAPSSQLLFLEVYEGELIPEFNKDGYKYYVTVPNEITSLDLEVNKNVVAVDEDAEITISNNSNFKVGINVVTIKVTASNNDVKNYYLYVTRSILASNYLSDLYVDDYEISPSFDPDTLYYELTVGSNVESVHVHGDKEDPTSTLEINGSEVNDKVVNLAYGENKVYFTVTSENGASRTYTLVITRSDSDEYYLLTLETNLGSWDKDFDKDDNGVYTISVPEKTSMIVFSGITSVGSTVEGLDSVQVKLGDNNHKIVVTSPSGLKNTYNFKIVRPGSNNTDILSITSNHGDLTLEDNVYKLSVDDSDSNISFIVNLSDKDAKVIMDSSYNLNYGKNEITITIQAEDGTEKDVSIEIYRYKDIASISYDEDEIILNIGEDNIPSYTINPEKTDYKEVSFRSEDETIATVDSNGKITAVNEGVTYVYITSNHKPSIYDVIRVNVSSTKLKSNDYTIWRVGESENNLASVDFSYVIGANDKTTIDDFFTHFENNVEYLKVYSSGTFVTNQTTYVGTGMTIKLEINNHTYDELTIIVRGDNGTVDKPGNGIITSTDYATLSSILAGLTVKTPIISLLYDLNKNKILTVTDLSPMSLYIAGKATFTNLNGLN